MKFTMRTPCPHCPFRTDIPGYLRPERMEEIVGDLLWGYTFTCHETTVVDDDDGFEMRDGPKAQHCAGALIFLEHQDRPNQLMRIAERLGRYDRARLDMDAPVPDNGDALVVHHDGDLEAVRRGGDHG